MELPNMTGLGAKTVNCASASRDGKTIKLLVLMSQVLPAVRTECPHRKLTSSGPAGKP